MIAEEVVGEEDEANERRRKDGERAEEKGEAEAAFAVYMLGYDEDKEERRDTGDRVIAILLLS